MKKLSKDYLINVCIILIIFVHAKHVHCESDDVNTDISAKTVTRARCLARCLDQFGTVRSTNDDEYPTKNCKDASCRQCTGPCDLDPFTFDKCGTDLCGGNQYCLSSCSFLKDLHAEALSKHDATQVNHSTILKAPEILCKNVPYGENKCPDLIATVYLRINSYPVNTKLSSVFVISARYINEMNDVTNWTAIKTTAETIVEIPKLRCSTDYQFMVTTVLSDNVYGQSKSTAWSRTPGYNYKPAAPISLSVSEPFLVNQKPSITVTWDPGPEAPCYYKIFWFDQTVLQDEIKVPRKFSYRIDNLKFAKNYTIRLYSIDDALQHTSDEKIVYAITPNCLEATGYNHSVCAPEKPKNLTLEVLTPAHMDLNVKFVNVSLLWEPPDHTHNGNDVLRYILVYRKEPPFDVAKHLEPHKGEVFLNATATSVTLYHLHNHNLYSFELSAVTTGGKGDSEFIKVYIGFKLNRKKDCREYANVHQCNKKYCNNV